LNGIIHESTENTNADEIPDYDNLGDDDDDDDDDDEIQYSDRFGMYFCCLLYTYESVGGTAAGLLCKLLYCEVRG